MGNEERVCKLCERGLENWDHYIGECEVAIKWTLDIEGFAYKKISKMAELGKTKEILKMLEKLDKGLKRKKKED